MIASVSGIEPLFVFDTLYFNMRMTTSGVMPTYKGALLRGALDNTFRRIVCSLDRHKCASCERQVDCAYMTLFHPSPRKNFPDAAKFANPPPPYLLKPPAEYRESYLVRDTFSFGLTLIGRALDAIPLFIYAFKQIGRFGLGRTQGCYRLLTVKLRRPNAEQLIYDNRDQTVRCLPPLGSIPSRRPKPVNKLRLVLQTPLRIKQNGKLVTRLDFVTLFKSLAQRICLISAFYGENRAPSFTDLSAKAVRIRTVRNDTYWYDWSRYSTRQNNMMKLGGLRGEITFEGELTPFLPWLRLGEEIHVGQGSSFGLGNYTMLLST